MIGVSEVAYACLLPAGPFLSGSSLLVAGFCGWRLAVVLRIRGAVYGRKNRRFYKLVVAEASSPRNGRFKERVGHYAPLLPEVIPRRVVLDLERVDHWISKGAKPSDRVARLLKVVS